MGAGKGEGPRRGRPRPLRHSRLSPSSRNSVTVSLGGGGDGTELDMLGPDSGVMCVYCGADPMLIYSKVLEGGEGFEGTFKLFPDNFNPNEIQPEFSGMSHACNTHLHHSYAHQPQAKCLCLTVSLL